MNAAVSAAMAPVAPVTPVAPSAPADAGSQEPGGAPSFSQVMKDVAAAPEAGGEAAKTAPSGTETEPGETPPRGAAREVEFNAAQLQLKTALPRGTAAGAEDESMQAGAQAAEEPAAQPAAAAAFVMPPWLAMMLPADLSRPPAASIPASLSQQADSASTDKGFALATTAPVQAAYAQASLPAGVQLSTAPALGTAQVFTLTAASPAAASQPDAQAIAEQTPALPASGAAPLGNVPAMLAVPSTGTEPVPAPVHQGHIASHPQSPAFAQDLAAEVKFLVKDGLQSAHLNLNPAELGPIRIELNISSQVADISFVAAHAATREGIEQSLPQLREMLSSQGMSLGHAGVAADTRGGQQEAGRHAQAHGSGHSDMEGSSAQDLAAVATVRVARGMLDLYA
jgi:flagellar hook-length control protein FliK